MRRLSVIRSAGTRRFASTCQRRKRQPWLPAPNRKRIGSTVASAAVQTPLPSRQVSTTPMARDTAAMMAAVRTRARMLGNGGSAGRPGRVASRSAVRCALRLGIQPPMSRGVRSPRQRPSWIVTSAALRAGAPRPAPVAHYTPRILEGTGSGPQRRYNSVHDGRCIVQWHRMSGGDRRDLATLTNQLRQRRLAAGLSQQALAEQAGVARQAVHAIETGRYLPNTLVALRLARVLRCRVEALF